MRHLVKYFLLKSNLKTAPLFLLPIFMFSFLPFSSRGRLPTDDNMMSFAFAFAPISLIFIQFVWRDNEFDLLLPFSRIVIFRARLFVTFLMPLFVGLVVGLCILLAHRFDISSMMLILALRIIGAAAWIAGAVAALLILWQFIRSWPLLLALPLILFTGAAFMGIIPALAATWPLGIALSGFAVMALAWTWGVRLLASIELVPGDSETAMFLDIVRKTPRREEKISSSNLLDRQSPFLRIIAKEVWLRWWYPPLTCIVSGFTIVLAVYFNPFIAWYFVLFPSSFVPPVIQSVSRSLLPLANRKMTFRSVLLPLTLPPLLIGVILSSIRVSLVPLVAGLLVSASMLFSAWAHLPSVREAKSGRRFTVGVFLWSLLFFSWICWWAVLPFFWKGKNTFERLNASERPFVPHFDDHLLVAAALLCAVVFLWWRCERKYQHYEPFRRTDLQQG